MSHEYDPPVDHALDELLDAAASSPDDERVAPKGFADVLSRLSDAPRPGVEVGLEVTVLVSGAIFEGHEVALEGPVTGSGGAVTLGIRPEYIAIGPEGIPAQLVKVADVGRHYVLDAMVGSARLKAVSDVPPPPEGSAVNLVFKPEQARVYRDGWIATEKRA